jgi:predicted phosphate transport protein (TIGR00153 family)
MRGLFHNFFANKKLFFDLFDNDACNMVYMAETLVSVAGTDNAYTREQLCLQINKMESTGDDITHKIHLYLDKYTFTPLNRNDIHALASAIDDVADMIRETGARLMLYNITYIMPAIKEIAAIILKASLIIKEAIALLRFSNNAAQITHICRQIKTYERQADTIYYNAVSELFLNDKDAINVIKYREILLALESTVNQCKSTADALETILINR